MQISRSTAPHYNWGGDCDGWRYVDRQDLSVIYERMPVDRREVRHFHERAMQLFFVLAGQLTIEMDGVRHQIGPNEAFEVAPSRPHQVMNDTEDTVEFLVISQPSTREDRVPV